MLPCGKISCFKYLVLIINFFVLCFWHFSDFSTLMIYIFYFLSHVHNNFVNRLLWIEISWRDIINLSYLNIFYVLKKNIVDSAHNSGLWTGKWNRLSSNLCRLTEFKATVSSILEIMIALKGPREIYPYRTSVNAFSVVRGELIPPGILVSTRHKNGATAKCCRVFQSP